MSGLSFVAEGLSLIFQPKLRRFVYIPLLINSLVFILLWGLGFHFFGELIAWLDSYLPSWLAWLNFLFWLIYVALGLLVSAYLFTWVANFIAAPFYGLLSEQVQHFLKADPVPEASWVEVIKDTPKALAREWQKLVYYLPRALGLLIISLIPGLNIVSAPLWFIFGAWMQTLQYVDYPLDNNRKSFKELKQWMSGHKSQSFGFGAGVMLLMMIPVINIVIMPAAVAGATAMVIKKQGDFVEN